MLLSRSDFVQQIVAADNAYFANMNMKFHPHRKLVAIWGLCFLTCSLITASYWLQSKSILTLILFIYLLMIAVYFIGPVIRNQIIEITGNELLLYSFGRKIELDSTNLYKIVESEKGIKSYRFRKNRFEYQVTPYAYHDSIRLQEQFDQMFKIGNLKVKLVNEKPQNK